MISTQETTQCRQTLQDAYLPVALTDVHVGEAPNLSNKFRAVVRADQTNSDEPFAIVTNRYRLIRHEDAMDLGYEAFERIFRPGAMSQLEVYNVLVSKSGGSFLADLTAPRLRIDVRSPPLVNRR